jgi:hypothetical protein
MELLGIRVSVEECYIIFLSRSNQSGRYPLELFGIPLLEILPYAAFGFGAT